MNPPEALEPYAPQLVDLMMELSEIENEENAILCMKIVMDLLRQQKKVLGDKVQPFLDLIQLMFRKMEDAVKETLDGPSQGSQPALPSTPSNPTNFQSPRPGSPVASASDLGAEQQTTRPLLKGMQSFKVLAECPIIVVSLFHAHRTCVSKNVKLFVPCIIEVLRLEAEPQARAHAEAKKEGKIFTGVSPRIRNRAAFGDFITAQVKTMSFMAYLLRIYAEQMQEFLPHLPDVVVRLLKDCPRERSAARKELLVAIRHIINYNIRKIFIRSLDDLLNERILIGDGLTVYEAMRPLAYSMLADLIHHVRDSLTKEQIRRTVEVYTKNLHDDFPGTSFQTMSAKLLLNMADCIAKLPNKKDARYYLIMILNAIGDKFAAMNRQYDNAKKITRKLYSTQLIEATPEDYLAEKEDSPEWDEIDIFGATPIKTNTPRDRGANPVADNKFLFKNLMNGLKNMFYQLKICNPAAQPVEPANTPSNWPEVSFGYDAEEVEVITKLFREGAHVFRYYSLEKPPPNSPHSSPVEFLSNHYMVSSGKEEKDLLETFATVFHYIDAATFHEVFHSEIPGLYKMMFEHTALLHVPQFFLASDATSPSFAGMLLQFLMGHIDDVGSSDVQKSSILLRLFKLSFMAVTLFSAQNEQVLLPHVTKILTRSIQLSATADEPMNYFLLLRSLFRSIGGGRFELLYKEILPLLEMLLEVLNNLLLAAKKPQERDLYVELCLTVPARLSNLLPHLSYLMRPLTVALRAGSDLVSQGLRTLELCVDNLTADYLDPIMAPVMQELMAGLYEHLQPSPYSHFHSHTTMRILGKLGGRNRKFLNAPSNIDFRQYSDDIPSFDIKLIGANDKRAFPTPIGIELAIAKLMEIPKTQVAKKSDTFYKQQAFRFVSSQTKLYIGADSLPEDFAYVVRVQARDLLEGNLDFVSDLSKKYERERSTLKREDQEQTLKRLLKACVFAASNPELKVDASAFVANVCRHFTILEVGRAMTQMKQLKKPFDVQSSEGPMYLDSKILANVIVESLSSDRVEVRQAAADAVRVICDAAAIIFGSQDAVDRLPFFRHLGKTFCHSCYSEDWSIKAGGSLGIRLLATEVNFGDTWLSDRQVEFLRALMYVIKDMPNEIPASARTQAQDTLEALLRRCNKHASRADLDTPSSRLANVCGYMVYELAHMNKHVRQASQRAFGVVAEVVGIEVHELLACVKDRLLSPIYNKPLRALPFPTQIGYIDAMSFCMGLQHGIVEFNEQLNRLLMESLALADADDESLAAKPNEYRTAESIVNLRISCIRLLSMAMMYNEFGSSAQDQSRSRIISVFFKCLYSKSSDVIDAAYAGMKTVLAHQHKLPKMLLQNGLRPILMNLQEPKRLCVPALEGLCRLLTLLTNYFKVEIGTMLLSHLSTIADHQTLQRTSFMIVEQNPQMKLIAAIFETFHLLPGGAVSFMPDLVNAVLDLEDKLRRTHYSPFRQPLLKYLSRYSAESWRYFRDRFNNLRYGRFLAQLLDDDLSGPIRDVIIGDVDGLLASFVNVEDKISRYSGAVNAIHVIHSIVLKPQYSSWISSQENLRARLLAAGKELEGDSRLDNETAHLRLAADHAGEQLMTILTKSMAATQQNIDFLFEVIDAVSAGELKPYPSLFKFIYDHIISSNSVEFWRSTIVKCLDLLSGRTASQQTKTFAFHYLVNPILAMDIMRNYKQHGSAKGSRLMDKSMTEAIHNKVWKSHLIDFSEDFSQPGVDHSRMELLQMSAMLIKYHHSLISDVRKDIIKFGWTSIRLEDIINKHAAYVLIAYFIAYYESPPRIVMQVYVALLRAYQNEGRALVTQALELIAYVLPKRVSSSGDWRSNMWAKWPKRIMVEESSNLQQLMSIFQFLLRHPDLFYDSREQFISSIIPCLARIAQPPSPSTENKKLALNLIGLIWQWEERRVNGTGPAVRALSESPQSKKRKLDNLRGDNFPPTTSSVPIAAQETSEYMIPTPLRMALIRYLVQFISILPERFRPLSENAKDPSSPAPTSTTQQASDMVRRSLQYLHSLLSPRFWDDLDLDLFPKVTEPCLCAEDTEKPDGNLTTTIINMLQVVRIIVNAKSDEWVVASLPQLQKLLAKPLRSESPDIQDCLHGDAPLQEFSFSPKPLVKRILDAIPEETPDEEDPESDVPSSEFIGFLSGVATETLAAGNHISSVNILWTLAKRKPSELDQHFQSLLKAFSQKLSRECTVPLGTATAQPGGAQAARLAETARAGQDANDVEMYTDLVLKTIDLFTARMSALGDHRRPFLIALASLVEKSNNTKICMKILGMVESWVFSSTEAFPTLKEKTAVIHKMLVFESRPDPTLFTNFLNFIIRIYEDPQVTRTELTVRLEHAFLIGTRAQDVDLRNRFITIFDRSLTRTASARVNYVLTTQNWDTLADSFWLSQASQLVIGAVEMGSPAQLHPEDFRVSPPSILFANYRINEPREDIILEDQLLEFINEHKRFCTELAQIKSRDILEPISQLQHLDSKLSHELWVCLFPLVWSNLSREDRTEMERGMISMLTKDYHQRQADKRPNVVQTLLEGAAKSKPKFKIPPHVLKFLSRTYDAWYTAICALEDAAVKPLIDTPNVRESNLDALVELYATLQEDDLFYGTWRRRCQFIETNAALSYEQNGMWDKAQQLYEAAQIKARTGGIPFSQAEYMIWEDHWVACAQKLQQWDILYDFAKHENFNDLLLECAWRQFEIWGASEQREWLETTINGLMDAPTPRRSFFQAFMSLLKLHAKTETVPDFNRHVDEAVQLSIRKWHQLPKNITNAHIPMLHNFQELVELHDASVICASLAQTNQQNLDTKSQELKILLTTWRDRLPNIWDDINIWQDLVTWRQHIFNMINSTYLTLLPPQGTNATRDSYAYRGYHETAWIINRFAHVARKHQLPEVCMSQLSKIYTLPNIEIQEAFLKLREQAKCHSQDENELSSGLHVINNTNLNYFGAQQKAEFFTLKGMFLAKLNHSVEANEAFGTALFYDIKLAKAWAEWGHYNDENFKETPTDYAHAAYAVSCYLEAAGLYRNAKSRKLLGRILWLISLDDAHGTISEAFEAYKGDTPVWYWITYLPQLLTALSHKEARLCRAILIKVAKVYPQALYFLLRTTREDMLAIKKQQDQRQGNRSRPGSSAVNQASPQGSSMEVVVRTGPQQTDSSRNVAREDSDTPEVANAGQVKSSPGGHVQQPQQQIQQPSSSQLSQQPQQQAPPSQPSQQTQQQAQQPVTRKYPWELTEEIMSVLKTAFPLLALSMETMVDQIQKHFKCPPDEDAYRLIVALLNDGLSYVSRMPSSYGQDIKLPPATEANITRFAETVLPAHIRKSFETDFVVKKPTMHEYIHKLRRWRDKFEEKLDRRPTHQSLELFSPHLSEFRFQKFDEVEVPGQYLQLKDKNQDFVRIERFMPDVDLVRGVGVCHRRLKIRGHDGSMHPFAVQHPAARHCRREERILQLFRILNGVLARKKESRRRNLSFHLPVMVPLAPHIRLVQDDVSYISLQGIYEDYCRRNGLDRDEPILFTLDKLKALSEVRGNVSPVGPLERGQETNTHTQMQSSGLRMEAFTAIHEKLVPSTLVLQYFQKTHDSFSSFWLTRRQFSYQLACLTFMTYIMHMSNRQPHKMSFSRATGNIWGSELIPAMAAGKPSFHNAEPVPFRLTPNLQTLMGPLAMEGIFSCSMMSLARCLTKPEFDLEASLSVFVRDEMIFWFTQQHRSVGHESQLRETVQTNAELVVRRAVSMAEPPVGNLPANQTVIDLVARAVNPINLAQTDALWMPYL